MNGRPPARALRAAGAVAAIALVGLAGCGSAMDRIDRRTTELLIGTSERLGPDALPPQMWAQGALPEERPSGDPYQTGDLPTQNPAAGELEYARADESQDVIARLERYARPPDDPATLDLVGALRFAMRHGREYRFAEEDYVSAGLQLLAERHLWGPRLFDDLSTEVISAGDGGLYDTSLLLVNDLRVTQRLPWGGQVSARLLAAATENLHRRVAGENVQTAELILSGDVPLLRGAGMAAREELIQLERDVVYAARDFENFRRQYLFDIAADYLQLVVLQLAIVNAERRVEQLEQFESRERALVDSGRVEPFQAALAAQDTLFARDELNGQLETYRLAIDRFKIRIGMDESQALVITPDTPDLPVPDVDLDEAVRAALAYRLDLQNRRDQVDDSRRRVAVARNDLLADLNLAGSIAIPTDGGKDRAGLDFDLDDTIYRASVTLGLPLDRQIERLALRQAQIDLERALLDYDQFRDTVAVEVRASAREIDRSRFSRDLQEENVRIADLRLASIEAAPDRATARDRSEAADDLLRARNDLLRARRDRQVSILQYLLDRGQLRVAPDGTILPLRGMTAAAPPPAPDQPRPEAPPPPRDGAPGSGPPPAGGEPPQPGDPGGIPAD